MTPIGAVHTTFAFVAIGAGAVVLLLGKGTRWHRTLGHLYAMSMLGTCASAFAMYDLTGSFGVFHFAAIVAGVTLAGGLYSILARRPRKQWIDAHAIWMSWSYVGLMAAFAAESLTRFVMPRAAPFLTENSAWPVFWTSVGAASFAICGIGWWLIKTLLPATIARTPEAMQRERRMLREREEQAAEASAGPAT